MSRQEEHELAPKSHSGPEQLPCPLPWGILGARFQEQGQVAFTPPPGSLPQD